MRWVHYSILVSRWQQHCIPSCYHGYQIPQVLCSHWWLEDPDNKHIIYVLINLKKQSPKHLQKKGKKERKKATNQHTKQSQPSEIQRQTSSQTETDTKSCSAGHSQTRTWRRLWWPGCGRSHQTLCPACPAAPWTLGPSTRGWFPCTWSALSIADVSSMGSTCSKNISVSQVSRVRSTNKGS